MEEKGMFGLSGRVRVSFLINVIVVVVFILASTLLVWIVRVDVREVALREAEEKARVLLDRNMATHIYFSHTLKPSVFAVTDECMPDAYFEPAWMSSTYAVRETDRLFRSISGERYYYKECAINARTPENEADEYERGFIDRLNREEGLQYLAEIREIDGEPFLAVLRKGEVMEEACLRCHATPEEAPAGLVDIYGRDRSFHRAEGEVVSAISIRIPLASAYAGADRTVLRISAVLIAALIAILGAQVTMNRALVFSPLERIRSKAVAIVSDERHLGEEVGLPAGRELADLGAAFNLLSKTLRKDRDGLEEQVQTRTALLKRKNEDLEKALSEVKQLSGLLPICAACKKIRDDKGYWRQIEEYIHSHSEAVFSHGLCPGCVEALYPDLAKGEDGPAA